MVGELRPRGPAAAAGTEKASTSLEVRGLGHQALQDRLEHRQACFSFGFRRPSAIGRRASALNMFAKRSVAEPKMTSSSPSRK